MQGTARPMRRTTHDPEYTESPPLGEGELYRKKVVLLGDHSVGKTSLIRRFVVDRFSDDWIWTLGTKVTKKDLRFPPSKAGLTMYIWDIYGRRSSAPPNPTFLESASGALLVYDVTRGETMDDLREYWLPALEARSGPVPAIVIGVVGNKVDLADDTEATRGSLADFSRSLGVPGFVSSARTGENVEQSFAELARRMLPEDSSETLRKD